jgi:hypothetical protein
MSRILVPIRWGVREAFRALSWRRLTAMAGCVAAGVVLAKAALGGPAIVAFTLAPLIIALSPPSGVAMPPPAARSGGGGAGGLARAGLATALAAAVCGGWAWATSSPTTHEALVPVVFGAAGLSLTAAALRQSVSAHPVALAILAPVLLLGLSALEAALLQWVGFPVRDLGLGVLLPAALGLHAVLSFVRRPGPEGGLP